MMKSIIYIAILAIGLTGCSNNGSRNEKTSSDNTDTLTDTLAVETIRPIEKETSNFLSDDLKGFGLLGNVKNISNVTINGNNGWMPNEAFINEPMSFNEEGVRITPKSFDFYEIKRDREGFTESISTDFGSSNGSGAEFNITEKNEWGWPIKANISVDNAPEYMGKGVATFTYPDIDKIGNWTTQKVAIHINYDDFETGKPISEDWNITRSRTITYHK